MYAITQQQQQQQNMPTSLKNGENGETMMMTKGEEERAAAIIFEQRRHIENVKFDFVAPQQQQENGIEDVNITVKKVITSSVHYHHHNHHQHHQDRANYWDYDDEGQCGPEHWLKLCGCTHLGNCQSPIDLQISQMRILPMDGTSLSLVNYGSPLAGHLLNNGHSIQFVPDSLVEPPEIYGGKLDQNYRFVQYHFHWAQEDNKGSEHTIGGLHYQGELHLVHQGVEDPNKLAVLAIFLQLHHKDKENTNGGGATNKFVFDANEMEALRKVPEFGQKVSIGTGHCLALKLPANLCHNGGAKQNNNSEYCVSTFIRYRGSLTTPPCTENVTWTVFTDPLLISKEQITLLRAVKDCRGKVIAKNYRPVQKVGNREVHLLIAPSLGERMKN